MSKTPDSERLIRQQITNLVRVVKDRAKVALAQSTAGDYGTTAADVDDEVVEAWSVGAERVGHRLLLLARRPADHSDDTSLRVHDRAARHSNRLLSSFGRLGLSALAQGEG
jgi:hypothetical protein